MTTAEFRARTTGHLFMVLVAMAVGLCGAIGAVVFRFLIRLVQATAFEGIDGLERLYDEGMLAEAIDPLAAARGLDWYWRLVIPAFGGLIVGPLIYFFAREAKGHGVPEVMAAVALRGGVIRRRIVAVKALASAICIGTGGSVGREGPIVQIASAMGSSIGQLLKVPASQLRVIVACGAAAGISATFNAPIAGALFAAEVIIGNFAVAQLSPIVISSVVATVVSRFFLGNHPAFVVPGYELVSPFELVPYMVAGVAAGFVALAFMLTLYASEDAFDRFPIPDYWKPAIGGLLVGGIGVFHPNVFGVGYGTITDALNSALPGALLLVLLIAKIAATSITLGSGGSGGIFAPSLFLGAMTGGFIGTVIHEWFPASTASSGAYALVTMGAVVAAATHAPITAIIIIFELTQTINIIPPLMAACVVSTLVTTFASRDSIYTMKLRRRGIDLFEEENLNILKRLRVHDIVDQEPEILQASDNFQTVVERVLASEHTQFFVVNRARGSAGLHPPARAGTLAGGAGRAQDHHRRRGPARAQRADGHQRRRPRSRHAALRRLTPRRNRRGGLGRPPEAPGERPQEGRGPRLQPGGDAARHGGFGVEHGHRGEQGAAGGDRRRLRPAGDPATPALLRAHDPRARHRRRNRRPRHSPAQARTRGRLAGPRPHCERPHRRGRPPRRGGHQERGGSDGRDLAPSDLPSPAGRRFAGLGAGAGAWTGSEKLVDGEGEAAGAGGDGGGEPRPGGRPARGWWRCRRRRSGP